MGQNKGEGPWPSPQTKIHIFGRKVVELLRDLTINLILFDLDEPSFVVFLASSDEV